MDSYNLSLKVYGFHTAVSTNPATQTPSHHPPTVYTSIESYRSSDAAFTTAHLTGLQAVTSPAAYATAAWGIAGKRDFVAETLQHVESDQSRKRYKASPNNKEGWRERLCEGSAVEVRWGKDWWNAHVIQVCLFILHYCTVCLLCHQFWIILPSILCRHHHRPFSLSTVIL